LCYAFRVVLIFNFKEFFMLSRHLVALSLIAASSTVFADTFDINLRDTSAQFQYSAGLGSSTLGKSEMHLGYLYTSKTNSYADFGILVKDQVSADVPGLMVGVGIKGVLVKVTTRSATAVALGGMVRYAPPAVPRIGIVGAAYWSPNIMTFGDADRTVETGAGVEAGRRHVHRCSIVVLISRAAALLTYCRRMLLLIIRLS
jgi:YfaZ precursor